MLSAPLPLVKPAFAHNQDFRVKKIGGTSEYNRRYQFKFYFYDDSTDDNTGFLKHAHVTHEKTTYYRIDGVVVKDADSGPFREPLILEVKSKELQPSSKIQLYLNMMPVLMKEDSVVGLLINPVQAQIFQMNVVKEGDKSKIHISSKSHCLHAHLDIGLVNVLEDFTNIVH